MNNCVCLICEKHFHVKPSQIKRGGGKYCSYECKYQAERKIIPNELKIVELYQKGHGLSYISRKYKTHNRKIKSILTKHKISFRTHSEQTKIEYQKHLTKVRRAKIVRCKICGESFKFRKNGKEIYCSYKCRDLDMELRDKKRLNTLKQIAEGRMPKTNTSIERKIKALLEKLEIDHIHQYPYGYWVFDFFIPKFNFFIECDGDYWHGNPKFYSVFNKTQQNVMKRGKAKDTYAKNRNFLILRFWEDQINNNIEDVENEILQHCK